MIFSLDALNAQKGDSLVLSWGAPDKLRHIVIDGGPNGVWKSSLEPRLMQLRDGHKLESDEPLPLDMVMISHIDDDHINGVLDFFQSIRKSLPSPLYKIKTLWHNSFDDILGNGSQEMKSRLASFAAQAPKMPAHMEHSVAVVASVGQGRLLRTAANELKILLNGGFVGLVMAKKGRVTVNQLGGLKFHIIGPAQARLEALAVEWEKDVKKNPSPANVAAFVDNSVANLSSIVVVAECGGKTMLLTGDARGDDILEGLTNAGFTDNAKTGQCHFNLLKMPHHGSDRNMTDDFLRRITADHYVFSANGEHNNPDKATIDMLGAARKSGAFKIHFTNDDMIEPKSGANVGQQVKAALKQHKLARKAVFRKKDKLGVRIDLLDALPY
jgi:hypothetical protein